MRSGLLALLLAALATAPPARAAADLDPPEPCTLRGPAGFSASVYSQALGGEHLLTLSSLQRQIELTELPADSRTGRARLRAHRDVPGLRVDGYIAASAVMISATRDLPVVDGHVRIRGGTDLVIVQPTRGDLQAEPVDAPFARLRARVECAELRLVYVTPKRTTPLQEWYLVRKSTPLFDAPLGKQVFVLDLLRDRHDLVMGSFETKGAWHRVSYTGSVLVDGWMRAADLEPYEPEGGVMMGGLGMMGTGALTSTLPVMTAKFTTPVLLGPSASSTLAGTLDQGARVRVKSAANGYSVIELPDGDASAPPGREFHVRTADLAP